MVPRKGTQNTLNIQPVIPITVSPDWNIITRTILPLIWQQSLGPGDSSASGIGDLQFGAFLSSGNAGGMSWGALVQAPTHSDAKLGSTNGRHTDVRVLRLEKGDPWVYGVLVNNAWSTGGGSSSCNKLPGQDILSCGRTTDRTGSFAAGAAHVPQIVCARYRNDQPRSIRLLPRASASETCGNFCTITRETRR